jgi:2-haloacid dehalogenase/putative hydrolase of the HAD superfamily
MLVVIIHPMNNGDHAGDIGPLDGVFLDFYGTLAGGDRKAVQSICQAVIEDNGLNLTGRELAVKWGTAYFAAIERCDMSDFRLLADIERDTLIETVEPLAGPIDAAPYVDQLNRYLARPELFEEVREVLDALTISVCIVSNADDRELMTAVEHHGLRFDYIVTSESARSYKPDARIFNTALKHTGWSADSVIHVGDSLHSDVGGAQRVGLRTAWVHRDDRISDIGTEKPDYTWHDLRPLLTLRSI